MQAKIRPSVESGEGVGVTMGVTERTGGMEISVAAEL
jgi:hypothetical protein